MTFYTGIHCYYDYIFPLNTNQIDFTLNEIPGDSKILDVGCATGNLAMALSQKGFKVCAFDLDKAMIETAKSKTQADNPSFRVGNMLNIETDYEALQFDGVLCFGNTLVHLSNKKLIGNFIKAVYSVLKDGGKFMFQILNYDYILSKRIKQLPVIENDKIKFIRKYEFMQNGLLNFITHLTIKENNTIINNQIELYPITKNEILKILTDNGFSNIQVFGSFAKKQLTKSSLPLIVKAVK